MSVDSIYTNRRLRMVADQLSSHQPPVTNKRVLEAMRTVPRHQFVPNDVVEEAYEDRPLPIGYGQTISQPYIVGLMTELLDPQPDDRILEIGTGSGYQAAILSHLVNEVYTVEIVPELSERAKKTLTRSAYPNVHLQNADGNSGWAEYSPFDAIIVTCAPEAIPAPLSDQLKDGGRMLIPVGKAFDVQELILLRKNGTKLSQESILKVRFVPMTGEI